MFIDSEIDFVEFRRDRLAHYAEEGMLVKIIMHRLRARAYAINKNLKSGDAKRQSLDVVIAIINETLERIKAGVQPPDVDYGHDVFKKFKLGKHECYNDDD